MAYGLVSREGRLMAVGRVVEAGGDDGGDEGMRSWEKIRAVNVTMATKGRSALRNWRVERGVMLQHTAGRRRN
jgi:hypothetical protein